MNQSESNHSPKFLEGFEQDRSSTLWRYLDLEKLESMLEKNCLYFAAAKQFADRFEGSISHPHIAHRKKSQARMFGSDLDLIRRTEESTSKAFQELTRLAKVSCWHKNEGESAAMWELYLREGKGVAIKSTVGRLLDSLGEYRVEQMFEPETVWLGSVKYINFDEDNMKSGMLARFFYKRESFAHENELRAIISLRLAEEYGVSVPEDGILVPVDLKTLIEEIRVAPELDDSFVEEVSKMVSSYGLELGIKRSDMDRDPFF